MCEKASRQAKQVIGKSAVQHLRKINLHAWFDICKCIFYKYLKTSVVISFIAISLWFVVWISLFAYGSFYYYIIPDETTSFPVHLQFNPGCGLNHHSEDDFHSRYYRSEIDRSEKYPTAAVPFTRNSKIRVNPGIRYNVDLELEIPESKVNQELGMFSIEVFSHNAEGSRLQSSTRSAMLRYKSAILQYFETFFFLPMLLAGKSEEKQKIRVAMFEDFEVEPFNKCEGIKVVIMSCNIQVYSSVLRFDAKLSGHRYYMQHWPLISASIGTAMSLFFFCSIMLFSWYRYLWPFHRYIFSFEKLISDEVREEATLCSSSERCTNCHQNLLSEPSANVSSTIELHSETSMPDTNSSIDNCFEDVPDDKDKVTTTTTFKRNIS